jgi:hypothetical protein
VVQIQANDEFLDSVLWIVVYVRFRCAARSLKAEHWPQ